MTKIDPIDLKSLGLQNEKLVISILRKHGRLSQTQLRKLTGMSSSTSSYIIGRLRSKNLISEKQGKSTKRGAKPIMLEINSTGLYAVGVEISPQSVYVGLFDYNAQLVDTANAMLNSNHTPKNVCETIEINVKGLLAKNDVLQQKVAGIGIALSGSITDSGLIKLSSPLGWKNVNLKEMLTDKFDTEIKICSTRVRMLAEMDIQKLSSSDNILYINIGNGVGSHLIIDGHLMHGSTGRIGEIGHIVMDPAGPKCGCGNNGCLETFISGIAIAKKIRSEIADRKDSFLYGKISEKDLPESIISMWQQGLGQKDRFCRELLDYITDYFSRAACIAINCYDPQVIILAGYVTEKCFDSLSASITSASADLVYDNESRNIQIRQAQAGKNAMIAGSALAVLQ